MDKEISISLGRVYNIGNYENVKVQVGITDKGRTKEEIMKEVLELVQYVKKEIGMQKYE